MKLKNICGGLLLYALLNGGVAAPIFSKAENPIVIRLENGYFFAVYDDLTHLSANNRIGYAWSRDGRQWVSSHLEVPLPGWTSNIRTPQSILPAGDGAYWIYFTGSTAAHFDVVGRIKAKLEKL